MDARDDITPMDSPERCPLTELIRDQCAHCRPPQPAFVEALFDPPDDHDSGRCDVCDQFFGNGEGDWTTHAVDGTYLCSECAE